MATREEEERLVGERLPLDMYFNITSALAGLNTAGENEVNALRTVMGSPANFRMPSGGLTAASVKSMMGMQDVDIFNKIVNLQSQADIKDEDAYRKWYTDQGFDSFFFEAARDAFRKTLEEGRKVTEHQQLVAKGVHEAELRPYELRMKDLLEDQKEQEIAAGKPATTITVKIDDELHHLQWASDTQAYVPLLGPDGQPVVSQIDRPTTTEQNVQTYIKMLNDARAEELPPKGPLSKTEEAEIMRQYGLIDQVVQGGLSKELPTELFNAQIAFATSAQKMQRMLSQLSRPDVAIGGIKGIAKAFSAISGQTKQAIDAMASAAGEGHLLTHPYKFGVAQESVALHSNIIDLAYQLARAADPGGRLSDRDVQSQVNRITGSLQNKASFAKSLMEVYNQSYERMRIMYQFYNKRGIAGAEEPWETFLGGLNTMGILTGRLEEFEYTTTGGVVKRGVGYKYYDANGVEQIQPVSEWEVK
jgi:hypothetical protein|tara:strand:+ start:2222 stop:3646 length:1425 start_codon:yes stop_codon:yes gene_type:complete